MAPAHELADPVLTRIVEEDKVPWYKKKNLRMMYVFMFPACMGIEMTTGFDGQIVNTAQIVPSWQKFFGSPTGKILATGPQYAVEPNLKGFLGASYNLGSILALPFVPLINDRFGRRWSIMIGSLISVVGAIMQGFANGAAMYIVARIMLGFGFPFCVIAGSSMLGELGYPKERPFLGSLFNSSYFFGQIIAAAVGLGTVTIPNDWGWRIPSLLQIFPAMLQIVFIFFLPESPRYLISKDRYDEAFEILVKYHAEGDRDSVFVKAEMAQIEATIKIELESAKQSWMDLFRTSGMRHRLLVSAFLGLFTQWSGNTLISFYLNDILNLIGITDSVVKSKINVGISCWALLAAVSCALISSRYPRRRMYLTCACSLICCYTAWTISMERYMTTKKEVAAILTLIFIFLYSPCYDIAYNALTYTYLVELWPYAERSRGIAWFQFFGKAAGFFATYVNPIGLAAIAWKFLLVYICWLAFEIVFIYFLFPETHGRTLEELSFLFEGKDNAHRAVIAVEKEIDNEAHVEHVAEVLHVDEKQIPKSAV
ncbi:general substrate transporter [Tricladium varicosporioides]|nr:general substrate transporter [Hymenoscyphus varicosporioides]